MKFYEDTDVCAYYKRGFSLRECGSEFGLSIEGVRQILLRHRVSMRKPHDTRQCSSGLVGSQR